MINGISGIYSIESRIKEIESKLDSFIPDSGNKSSFTEILKSKNDEAVYLDETKRLDLSFEDIKRQVLTKLNTY